MQHESFLKHQYNNLFVIQRYANKSHPQPYIVIVMRIYITAPRNTSYPPRLNACSSCILYSSKDEADAYATFLSDLNELNFLENIMIMENTIPFLEKITTPRF